ncbi:hypothetical protein OPV22_010146 [Ensete ventricosum]|uniref:DUF4005 domain-containing protein n=1 Tax=Ensete ventricosum TaxID=4639 RepID=A0AAV8RCH3_ENSVE|nr:hypothetical protein OPV22_010146 [Ensete ventricosum]
MKPRQSGVRQFGQTSLPLSFFSKSRRVPDEHHPKRSSNKQPVPLSEFLNRKLIKTTDRSVKEKQTSFSSIGTATKDSSSRTDEACGRFILDDVIFRQFKVSTKGKEQSEITGGGESRGSQLESYTEGGDNSRKRKNPFDSSGGAGERVTARKSVIVLGDDPKPRRSRRGKTTVEAKNKPLYDHYANGSGWWDCSKEGVDSEEVGCNDFWEGMGSTTLGGLEWH